MTTHALPKRYALPTTLAEVPGDLAADCLRRLSWPCHSIDDAALLRACRARLALKHLKACDAAMERHLAASHKDPTRGSYTAWKRACRHYAQLSSWTEQLFTIALDDGDHHTRDLLTQHLEKKTNKRTARHETTH